MTSENLRNLVGYVLPFSIFSDLDAIAILAALIRIAMVIAIGYITYRLLSYFADAGLRRAQVRSSFATDERTLEVGRLIKVVIQVSVFIVTLVTGAGVVGLNVGVFFLGPWRGYLYAPILALAAHFLIRIGTIFIDELFDRAESERRINDMGRALTMRGLLKNVLRYTVDIAAWLLVLSNLGVNTTGLLASVGVAGLAIGFGAQSLVRDVITGFFILFVVQFFVCDYIETAGVAGIVQEIGLRITKIRDFGGQMHVVPNGQIEKVTNHSVGPMRVMFEVGIAYDQNVDDAIAVIEKACQDFASDDERIVDAPVVLGVTGVTDAAVNILVWGRTIPMSQWAVGRELRQAIKNALDAAGIQPPYPRRVWVASTSPEGGQTEPGD